MTDSPDRQSPDRAALRAGAAPADGTAFIRVGDSVGHLRILEPIASGGMACLYKAYHTELEVVRALKVLKPGYTDEARSRFQTEAKLSANLKHPYIVDIYDVGLWQGYLPYIEMEYVEGVSLDQLLSSRKRLPVVVAVSIAEVVCEALAFAASSTLTVYGKQYHGMVHRDIKPANILLSKSGTIKLVDFGVALPGSVSLHTTGGGILGTLPYASTEQLGGKPLDGRSDVYSLGCVLYEMLTGEKAFPQRSLPELISAKMGGQYAPVQRLVTDVPEIVLGIVDKSLASNRDDRFTDAASFGSALSDATHQMTDQSPPEAVRCFTVNEKAFSSDLFAERHGKRVGGLVLRVALVAIAAAALAYGLVWIVHQRPAQPQSADVVHEPPDDSRTAQDSLTPSAIAMALSKRAPASREEAPARLPRSEPPRRRSDTAGVARESAVDTVAVDHVAQGQAAFRAGNFAAAAQHLEKALSENPDAGNTTELHLRLFESYLRSGALGRAQAYSSRTDIPDGYFYLLRAKTLFRLGEHAACEEELIKAQTTRSILGDEIRQEAVYAWAANREAMYKRKPNTQNRDAAVKAWRNYSRAFCQNGGDRQRCDEARRHIARHAP
ncbi:MAG: protein kinase [Chitinivibrionales bacterium]|nr:protein kinase [Chitinivibrionales bacterium]